MAINKQQLVSTDSLMYASFAVGISSQNTNGILVESPSTWWDEERIEATVTRQFILSKLRPDEQIRLDLPLGFGDGLTDGSYMEWIELKAKRLFLILNDLGVPDQIFGVIDDSWDDSDLPVSLDQVERLELTYKKDKKLEKEFFNRQFTYLSRTIQKGDHIYYNDDEVVPLELKEGQLAGQVSGITHITVDMVYLPRRPKEVFLRRRIPLGALSGCMSQEEFLSGVDAMKTIKHDHLISLWASYIYRDGGYLLLTPVNYNTLKSFLTVTPQSVKILAKQDRRILLLNWLLCLADGLAFLHSKGLAHRNIKPSNVMLDRDDNLYLGDSIAFQQFVQTDKRGFDKEAYDYSAPEQAYPHPTTSPTFSRTMSRGKTGRRNSSSLSTSHLLSTFNDASSVSTNSTGSHGVESPPTFSAKPQPDPQKSDVFSLGTIFLEILTVLVKRTSKNFASHRAAKNKTSSRSGGPPDSSFHNNLGQVETWMNLLSKDASKKEDELFKGVSFITNLVYRMMSANSEERPSAQYVRECLHAILSEHCGLGQAVGSTLHTTRGRIHCEERKIVESEWNFGFDELRLASQRAAAEACANLKLAGTETQTPRLNAGIF